MQKDFHASSLIYFEIHHFSLSEVKSEGCSLISGLQDRWFMTRFHGGFVEHVGLVYVKSAFGAKRPDEFGSILKCHPRHLTTVKIPWTVRKQPSLVSKRDVNLIELRKTEVSYLLPRFFSS
ncbi:hypothetical protein AVEN_232393-1 [Araneus ventricosus]|uniref:Uncharacterized protein n=1 Tax=Araneus ventricosus TaxID=182803 RepID=A0A4Y2CVI4_ARAVE|nr:hypothetical protein AVEN_232393-1 [Araneus ventricosus]